MQATIVSVVGVLCLLGCCAPAPAAHIDVTMAVDHPTLLVGETTTLHVFAEVTNGAGDDGIFAYALDVLADVIGVIGLESVTQLGDPDPLFSGGGTISPDGLHDVYGGDGGFFTDRTRGIGAPFELLAISLRALSPGDVQFAAGVADAADDLGVPEGVTLLQTTAAVSFDSAATITVIPEPSALALLGLATGLLVRRR